MSDELDLEEILREVKRMNADPAHSGKSRPETPAEPAPAPEPQAEPAPAESPRAARRRQEREQRRIKQRALLRSAPFFMTLAIITVIAWLLPLRDTVSETERRELEKFPAFSVSAAANGSYFSQIGNWFADTFTFRESWMDLGGFVEGLYGHSDIAITGSVGQSSDAIPTPQVTAAPAETAAPSPKQELTEPSAEPVTETEKAPVETAEPLPSLSPEEVLQGMEYSADASAIVMNGDVYPATVFSQYYCDLYAANISRAAELLDGKCRVFDLIPLRCTSVKLDRSVREYMGFALDEDVLAYISSQMDERVCFVDSLTPLAAHKDEYIYFHSDHHWTALGAYYAYTEWAKEAGVEPVSLDEYTEGALEPYTGTFYHNSTKKNPVTVDTVYTYEPPGDVHLYIIDSGTGDSPSYRGFEQSVITQMTTPEKYSAFLAGDHALCTFVNNDIEEESACLIIKDSYGNPFCYYYTQHYKYVYVLDYRYYFNRSLSNFVDTYGVDDVIFCTSMFLVQGEGCNSLLNSLIR